MENIYALKTLRIGRIWLHVPSGILWTTSSDTHQIVEIHKKRLLFSWIPHFQIGFN